jgi:hypothetical protein
MRLPARIVGFRAGNLMITAESGVVWVRENAKGGLRAADLYVCQDGTGRAWTGPATDHHPWKVP